MKTLGMTLRDLKPQDLFLSAVLIGEALYFIIATAIITGFGVVFAQGNLADQGVLGTASLPLIAVGAFAVWSLALLHVLPPAKGIANCRVARNDASTKKVAQVGFLLVVVAHGVYGILLVSQDRLILGAGVLTLGGLLLGCCVSQFRAQSKQRHVRSVKAVPPGFAAQ